MQSNWRKEEGLTEKRSLDDDPNQRVLGDKEGMCSKFNYRSNGTHGLEVF